MKVRNRTGQKKSQHLEFHALQSEKMQTLVLDDMEAQFGLMLRDKHNHDNYVLIKLADLDRIFTYYSDFKQYVGLGKRGERR